MERLLARGQRNGIKRLRLVEREELHRMEPLLAGDCEAALCSPAAGTVMPYEFTIALVESAAMNGVQIRARHELVSVDWSDEHKHLEVTIKCWTYAAKRYG